MKITMYQLLGLVKDGKAPKKIIAGDSETEYYFAKELKDYISTRNQETLFEDEIGEFLKYYLNDTVEIIEEKKILEKIQKDDFEGINEEEPKLWIAIRKINEIIDYLNSKGE